MPAQHCLPKSQSIGAVTAYLRYNTVEDGHIFGDTKGKFCM